MSNRTIQKQANQNTASNSSGENNVEVLYQKMGNRWFAFSIVEGEVFMGSISQEEIDALEAGKAPGTFAISGNT